MLETERLILRKFKEEDIDDFFEYAQMEEVGPYCGWATIKERDKAIERLNRMISIDNYFAIVLKESSKVIGSVVLSNLDKKRYPNIEIDDYSKELGFALSKNYWGNGYMKEALMEVMKYAFDTLNISSLYALYASPNVKSGMLLEKIGFKTVGEIPDRIWLDGSKMSLIQMKMSSEVYFNINRL